MPRWTPEARRQQAESIRKWKPWEASTGPRTAHGKEMSSRNAEKLNSEFFLGFLEENLPPKVFSLYMKYSKPR